MFRSLIAVLTENHPMFGVIYIVHGRLIGIADQNTVSVFVIAMIDRIFEFRRRIGFCKGACGYTFVLDGGDQIPLEICIRDRLWDVYLVN